MLHRVIQSATHKGLTSLSPTHCWRNLMGGEARFDCRKRNMREKWRVIQGGGEGEEEEGGRLCWPKLDNDLSYWAEASVASSTQRNCLSKVKSSSGTKSEKFSQLQRLDILGRRSYICHKHCRLCKQKLIHLGINRHHNAFT